MSVHLVGGALDSTSTALLEAFDREFREQGRRLAIVLVERDGSSARFLPEYVDRLGKDAAVTPVLIEAGDPVDPELFAAVDGIVVGGGPTPEYHSGLVGAAVAIRAAVGRGVPYLGFSAGAMVAPERALLGGYLLGEVEVVHHDCAEGLDPLTVEPGLGLVRFTVDVHAAQAGTLSRAVATVESGQAPEVVAIDEDTCVSVGRDVSVRGSGSAWFITPSQYGVRITRRTADAGAAHGRHQGPRTTGQW